MLTSPEFPVSYGPSVFATYAAAESDSDLEKCEVVFCNEATGKICVNSPKRFQFDNSDHALGFCAMFSRDIPAGISLVVIFYENDADKEICESSICTGNNLAVLMSQAT